MVPPSPVSGCYPPSCRYYLQHPGVRTRAKTRVVLVSPLPTWSLSGNAKLTPKRHQGVGGRGRGTGLEKRPTLVLLGGAGDQLSQVPSNPPHVPGEPALYHLPGGFLHFLLLLALPGGRSPGGVEEGWEYAKQGAPPLIPGKMLLGGPLSSLFHSPSFQL